MTPDPFDAMSEHAAPPPRGYVICADCDRPVPADVHGACSVCGSGSALRLGVKREMGE